MGKTYTFCVHDESVNTYGFRMLTSGANLEEFRKNPVVLYNHNDWDTPIGRGENVRVEDGRILVDVVFDEEDEKGRTIAGKVERGFLRMASIGAWPPEEVSDDPALKLPGQTGPTAIKWTMREMSVCPIGSNHNALAMYDRATNKRIDLSDGQALVRLMDKKSVLTIKRGEYELFDTDAEIVGLRIRPGYPGSRAGTDYFARQPAGRERHAQERKQTLQERVTAFETKEKEANKQKAVALVDAAVKDGRIDAKGRESWLEDFAVDFAKAEVRLSSISVRQPVSPQVQTGGKAGGNLQLADMTFKEILDKDLLKELKKTGTSTGRSSMKPTVSTRNNHFINIKIKRQ